MAGKTAAFAESVQSAVGNRISTSDLFSDPFSYVDTSTAERVFELAGAVQLVSASGTTTLVGRGLGGALDLSGTRDRSVVMAHGGSDALESIRVVHLGITYALLKGGVCGLLAYLGFVVVAFVRAVRCMRAARTLWDSALVLCFIMYVSGSVFTFSNHFMAPALWVTWAVSGSLLNEATLLSRLRGPAGRRVPVPLRTAP